MKIRISDHSVPNKIVRRNKMRTLYEDHKRYAQAVVDFITSNNLNINRLKKLGNMCEKYFNIKDPKYYMNEIQ